ncbi:hypothetical protein [Sulfitobacter sp. R18_1]|uniref:hypothetical protein n=1 Tax=Sulfitobacter sp. R18_1 TaxID=2821104 RepID=UPI001ADC7A4C|nr:hypothetical protein [Sulfitobacter sp. R18_1]MBO9430537.1 hypothetical protein [Sulfitobacter sp. R18_1]
MAEIVLDEGDAVTLCDCGQFVDGGSAGLAVFCGKKRDGVAPQKVGSELFKQGQVVMDMPLHLRWAGQRFGDDIAIGKDRGAELGFKRITRGGFIGPGGLDQRERGQDCRGAHL